MKSIKVTVRVPHIQKEYDVSLPVETTGKKLYEALISRLNNAEGNGLAGPVVFELFSKKVGKQIYPAHKDQTLAQIGIMQGDTIILKKDMDPGSAS
jgi:hypothetical protein